jgi:hypothetical protein
MARKENKTPEYTRKAIAKYQSKFDRVNINLPRGLKDQVKAATGESVNSLVVRLLIAELEKNGGQYIPPDAGSGA